MEKTFFWTQSFFGCFFDSSCNCMVDAKKNHQSATLKISSLQGLKQIPIWQAKTDVEWTKNSSLCSLIVYGKT
jgi:hypothetical protein